MNEGAPKRGEVPSNRAVMVTLSAVLLLVYVLGPMLLPFLFAAALAYVSVPFVLRLRRFHVPRLAAVLCVYLVMVLILIGAGWWLFSALMTTMPKVSEQLPQMIIQLVRDGFGPEMQLFGQTVSADEVSRRIIAIGQTWITQPGTAWTLGAWALAAPAGIVLTLVLLFYFINSGRRLAEGGLKLAPPRYREHIRDLAHRIDPVLRQYIRGLLLIVAYTSLVAYIGLGLLFHLPFAPILSVMVGILELVPVVGPATSMTLIGLSALLRGGGAWAFFLALAFAVGLRVSIDEIVGPLVLGRAVALHPVVVIFAFLMGATLFGVLGVLLAVPVAASARIVLGVWYAEEQSGEKAGRDPVRHGVTER